MKRVQINTDVQYKRLMQRAYAKLAKQGALPGLHCVGICMNAENLLKGRVAKPHRSFVITSSLFEQIMGRPCSYPLKDHLNGKQRWEGGIRSKWCAAFAKALTTGVVEIDEEMEDSLQYPIPKLKVL